MGNLMALGLNTSMQMVLGGMILVKSVSRELLLLILLIISMYINLHPSLPLQILSRLRRLGTVEHEKMIIIMILLQRVDVIPTQSMAVPQIRLSGVSSRTLSK